MNQASEQNVYALCSRFNQNVAQMRLRILNAVSHNVNPFEGFYKGMQCIWISNGEAKHMKLLYRKLTKVFIKKILVAFVTLFLVHSRDGLII